MERRTYVLDLQVKRNITEKAEEDGSEKGPQWKGGIQDPGQAQWEIVR